MNTQAYFSSEQDACESGKKQEHNEAKISGTLEQLCQSQRKQLEAFGETLESFQSALANEKKEHERQIQ